MKKKPFKETKVGQWLSKNGPKVLDAVTDVAGTIYPPLGKIKDLISKDPDMTEEQKLEFQKLEFEFELEFEKLAVADLDSARKMQMSALSQEDRFSKRYVYYLSTFIIGSTIVFGFCLFFIEVPEKNQRLVDMFADVCLFASVGSILNFFFGRTVSKATKKGDQ